MDGFHIHHPRTLCSNLFGEIATAHLYLSTYNLPRVLFFFLNQYLPRVRHEESSNQATLYSYSQYPGRSPQRLPVKKKTKEKL